MKTSERLDKVADGLQASRVQLRRLDIDLPAGRTLELVEFIAVRLGVDIESLRIEAATLRKWND